LILSFNDAVSTAEVKGNRIMIMNGERIGIGKEALVFCLKILSRNSSAETSENQGKPGRDPALPKHKASEFQMRDPPLYGIGKFTVVLLRVRIYFKICFFLVSSHTRSDQPRDLSI
jgi:hypothetical protein